MTFRHLLRLIAISGCATAVMGQAVTPPPVTPHHWSYSGDEGPEHWAALDPANSLCASGKSQSPVDIADATQVRSAAISFDYKPGAWQLVDNGHTIQVIVPPGNSIEWQGHRFDLVQFHFHHPGEEAVHGRHADMVVHLVHKDPEGRLAVVAIPVVVGAENPVIQALWKNLSAQLGKVVPLPQLQNPIALIPADRRFYAFTGSLTTPPCTEAVQWLLFETPLTLSLGQINTFAALYPNNARPLQPLNARNVLEVAR